MWYASRSNYQLFYRQQTCGDKRSTLGLEFILRVNVHRCSFHSFGLSEDFGGATGAKTGTL
jgi:hypothetical protein